MMTEVSLETQVRRGVALGIGTQLVVGIGSESEVGTGTKVRLQITVGIAP